MSGSAVQLLEDIEVGYGDAVLAEVEATEQGLRIVQHDGFHLHLTHGEVTLANLSLGHKLGEVADCAVYLATVAKRVQMEAEKPEVDFEQTLLWVSNGPWDGADLDRLLGLQEPLCACDSL